MTIESVNVLDSKCPLRMLEMAFQSIKISKLSGGASPRPHSSSYLWLSHHSSMIEKYSDLHTQKVGQSAIFMAKFLSLAAQNALFTLALPLPKDLQKDFPQLEGGKPSLITCLNAYPI